MSSETVLSETGAAAKKVSTNPKEAKHWQRLGFALEKAIRQNIGDRALAVVKKQLSSYREIPDNSRLAVVWIHANRVCINKEDANS
jgi:hypothetical protein